MCFGPILSIYVLSDNKAAEKPEKCVKKNLSTGFFSIRDAHEMERDYVKDVYGLDDDDEVDGEEKEKKDKNKKEDIWADYRSVKDEKGNKKSSSSRKKKNKNKKKKSKGSSSYSGGYYYYPVYYTYYYYY